MKKAAVFTLIVLSTISNSAIADVTLGKKLFTDRCASCHGAMGAGDGPVGASLPPEMKPTNLQEPKRKFATDDAKFIELIKKGGASLGLSPMMPGQADLSDGDVNSILSFVKSLKK